MESRTTTKRWAASCPASAACQPALIPLLVRHVHHTSSLSCKVWLIHWQAFLLSQNLTRSWDVKAHVGCTGGSMSKLAESRRLQSAQRCFSHLLPGKLLGKDLLWLINSTPCHANHESGLDTSHQLEPRMMLWDVPGSRCNSQAIRNTSARHADDNGGRPG